MKKNSIFEAVYTDKIPKMVKSKGSMEWKKLQKLEKKKRKEKVRKKRVYNRIPRKYAVYIKSVHWEKRKNKYYKDFGKICFTCLTTNYIQLHHLKYEYNKFGEEPDDTLVPLCVGCHNEFHELFGVKKDMTKEFNEFVEIKNFPVLV